MQVERDYRVSLLTLYDSGARVRNAYTVLKTGITDLSYTSDITILSGRTY